MYDLHMCNAYAHRVEINYQATRARSCEPHKHFCSIGYHKIIPLMIIIKTV